MDLRDFIPEEEKDLLRDYITKYSYVDYEHSFTDINYRLRFWESAKHPLFQLMGQQIILTKEIDYEMAEAEIGQKITNAIDALEWDNNIVKFIDNFRDCIYRYYESVWNTLHYSDEDLVIENDAYRYLVHFFDDESFAGNKVWGFDKPTTIIFKHGPHAADKPLEIKSDTKLMRALGKLVDWFELDREAFEQLRIFVSQQTNDVRFKAECCLSIHPLDYLTMSDNDCGWDSCMNWTMGPGQYRLGTVEMMNSPVVIEAYVKSNHPYHPLDRREWSNKRWRCLYIVNKNIIAEVKAYPFQNTVLSKFFMGWIKELATTNMNWHYDDTLYDIKGSNFNSIGDKRIYIRMDTNVMYNDFYDNHLVYIAPNMPNSASIVINYSGETECMCCGESCELSDFQETDGVVCNRCLDLYCCHDCGSWLDESDIYFDDDGNAYCEWCAQPHTCECDCCESIKWENHFTMTKKKIVHVIANYKDYHYPLANVCICDECLKEHYIDKTNFYNDFDLEVDCLDEEMREQFGITQEMIDYGKKIVDERWKGYF